MAKQAAYGTVIQYIDPDFVYDPGEPLELGETIIHQVADISGPEISVETIDVTTHDSPDHYNEFIPGAADGGELTFELVFDPSLNGHGAIVDLVTRRLLIEFALILPGDTGRWNFLGMFSKCGHTATVKDALRASVGVKVSGKPTFTAPA